MKKEGRKNVVKTEQQYKGEWVYRLLLPLIYLLFFPLFTPKINNREYIPQKGRVIIAANHKHAFDPIIIMVSTLRPIHFLAKKEHFMGYFGWLFKKMSCICVDREKHNGYAMKEAISFLNDEKVIGVFPEGTRNRTNDLVFQDFKYGTVAMARHTGAPIIPAVITGDYRLFSKNLMISFGKPVTVPSDMPLEEANHDLQEKMKDMWYANLDMTGRTEEQELKSRKTKHVIE